MLISDNELLWSSQQTQHSDRLTVRIVDMSRLAAGLYTTMLLAHVGAEVIVVGGGGAGLPLEVVSRNKTFVSLNLKSDAGRSAPHRFVVETRCPGLMNSPATSPSLPGSAQNSAFPPEKRA